MELVVSLDCVFSNDMEVSIEHAFFHCVVVYLLCRLVESYMVCMLCRQTFILGAFCSNMSLQRGDIVEKCAKEI